MLKSRTALRIGSAAATLVAAGLAAFYLAFPGDARDLSFEDAARNADPEAEVAGHLNRMFARGTPLREVTEYLGDAGATCRDLPQQPDFVYCTYTHRDAGLRGLFIIVEWKLLLWRDSRDTLARIGVHHALTGP